MVLLCMVGGEDDGVRGLNEKENEIPNPTSTTSATEKGGNPSFSLFSFPIQTLFV